MTNIFQKSESESVNLSESSAAGSSTFQIPNEATFTTPKKYVQYNFF